MIERFLAALEVGFFASGILAGCAIVCGVVRVIFA